MTRERPEAAEAPATREAPQAPATREAPQAPETREAPQAPETREEAEAPSAPPTTAGEAREPTRYERILGAFVVDADLILLIDPVVCAAWCRSVDRSDLYAMAHRFEEMHSPRAEAAARLNIGALAWRAGAPEEAYREILRAQAIFSALGDIEGLAHAFEWLGFLFKESKAMDRAADHLGAAHKLYAFMGHTSDIRRILAYGSREAIEPHE